MSRRKKFRQDDYINGRIAEGWVCKFLSKNGFYFNWVNEKRESMLPYDFEIINNNNVIAAIEVEWKDVCNRKYFHSGVDYIANKVYGNYKKRIPVYYYLVMSDGSEIYKADMRTLKEKGYFFFKNTKFTNNEEFCRARLEDVSVIDLRGFIR